MMKRLSRRDAHRLKLKPHVGKADCQVSERWLQFPRTGRKFQEGTFLVVDVMTSNETGKERKLCELILVKEQLQHILDRIEEE